MSFAQYLATAPPDEFFWWCMIPIVLGAAGFISAFVFLRRTRLLEDLPTSRLRSAAQGYVELEGRARVMPGPPIVSALTRTRCVWWRYCVEQQQGSGKERRWVTIDSGTSDDCFELDDPTGRCVVDPHGASVIPSVRHRWYGGSPRPDVGPAAGTGLLRALFGNYRYTEELLLPDQPLYAVGSFRTQAGGPEAFDEQADLRELLVKWKHDRKMMSLLDRNKDGTVDMKEWEAARRMGLRKVRDEHVQRAVETPDLHILAKPRDGRPYILSGIPQARLIRRFRLYSAGFIALTAVCGVFVLWALQLHGLIA
jgi:hypothetical protein